MALIQILAQDGVTDDIAGGLGAVALLAWLAYVASRLLARQNVPELVGFLLVGAALGPSGLELVDAEDLSRLAPVTEIALAILMFIIGERVSMRALRAARWAATAGVLQYVLAAVAVYVATDQAGADQEVSLLLGTLAGAGAPLTIAHVVASRRARSRYSEGLISSHALCDALAATSFAAVLPIATLLAGDSSEVTEAVTNFLRLGLGGIALGVVFGLLIARLGFQIETSGELLLFTLVHILAGWAIADVTEISLPLGALVAGAVASSVSPTDFSQRLFRTVRTIEQPLYLMFFALAGASIHLGDLPEVGAVGVAYLVARVAGRFVGSVIGGPIGGLGFSQSVRLGVDSTPQAGVAVGLAVLASENLPGPGVEVATVVLGSVVVFELFGPLLVARGLTRDARSVDKTREPAADIHENPQMVLFASVLETEVPEWLLEACSRWGAELTVLLPVDGDAPVLADLLARCGEHDIDVRSRRYIRGESFTGTVVRLSQEVSADQVVLALPRPARAGGSSRLVLMSHERIGRQLDCPVLHIPLSPPGYEQAREEAEPSVAWWRRLRQRPQAR